MVDQGRNSRQVLLLSLLVSVIPMALFPEQLGTGLGQVSMLNIAFELIFYGIVVAFFNRHVTLVAVVKFGAICLLFRLGLGLVFTLLITGLFEMNISVALKLGIFSYLPAVFLHIASTPFILKASLKSIYYVDSEKPFSNISPERREELEKQSMGSTSFVATKSKNASKAVTSTQPIITTTEPNISSNSKSFSMAEPQGHTASITNGFDKATQYIGELASVDMAAVIDFEGLLLSSFTRWDIVAEDWAPIALLHFEQSQPLLEKNNLNAAEKIDFTLSDKRVIISREGDVCLMVVASRESEDLLNIRVNQSHDMIRSYLNERYGENPFNKVENSYVRSTQ